MAASTRNTYLSPILANNNLILSNWKLSNYSHWISRHIILFVKVSCHTYTSICEIKDIFPPAPVNIWPCHHLLWLISPEVTTQVSTKEKSTEKRFFWLMFDATFFPQLPWIWPFSQTPRLKLASSISSIDIVQDYINKTKSVWLLCTVFGATMLLGLWVINHVQSPLASSGCEPSPSGSRIFVTGLRRMPDCPGFSGRRWWWLWDYW